VINPFFGPRGLRSGWRVLAFLVIVLLLGGTGQEIAHAAPLLAYGLFALVALGVTWIMARLDGKRVDAYGLASARSGRNLLLGLAAGFAALSLVMVIEIAAGAFHPGGRSLQGATAVYWGIESAFLFLLVGLGEELMTRGYPLFTLWEGIGFWPAAAIMSLLFAAGHLGNGGEDPIGITNAVLVGIVFAYSVRWTGSLWWAIGCHASWDWAESYFYGVPNSGVAPERHFFSGTPAGPAWLSGGSAGPEGSAAASLVILLLAGVVRWTLPRRDPSTGTIPGPACRL
jgi:uncharacterized protein